MGQILGPTGNPISSAQFRKGAPPKLGEAFGNWAGRDLQYMSLPGGGIVQFDLNKLQLEDYRNMRDHHQVNASLSVLSFMLHQSDWHIESKDKKIAEHCEENLKNIWTQLNRALSTSNWAGYSPSVLQWENDSNARTVQLEKVKDLIPEECSVNWDTVDGYAPPGHVKPKMKIFDGIKQMYARWPIPVENCVTPETLVLKSNLTWVKAGDLEMGDEIIAFDEDERHKGRRYQKAYVDYVKLVDRECVTVETDSGDPVVASKGHPFLVRRFVNSTWGDRWVWVEAKDLKIGDRIGFFGKPSQRDESREAGYVAGIFDGEGSLTFTDETNSARLAFSQRDGVVLQNVLKILAAKGFEYKVHGNGRDDCKEVLIHGGRREIARFMEVFSPDRLKAKAGDLFDGVVMRLSRSVGEARVTGIFDSGVQQVASIQTSSRTFIANGYLSHNSVWYPMLMEHGDYYGKKLLRPAFQPWFFSILLHLFANRYYERFGEPVPVGRAPFDEDIEIDGTVTKGNTYMLSILAQLRNRSVVVLPNDTTDLGDGKRQYDYSVEYLESQMRGADFERYMTRLDEEISLGIFTPILLMRTADVGSYNLGVGHMQLWLWMLNALNADRKTYVDKYILRRMVDYNFSKNAPDAKIVFRKLGSKNEETIRAIVTALVSGGKVMPDLLELGQMAGMTLEKVKETVKPPEEPVVDPDADPDADPSSDPNADVLPPAKDNREARIRTKKKTAAVVKNSKLLDEAVGDMTARVQPQVANAFRDSKFTNLNVSLGFKKKIAEALGSLGAAEDFYESMDAWIEDALPAASEMSGPEEFMVYFCRTVADKLSSYA